jgi:predicted  nucleic acid-binding Zn-ribbon protein
MIRKKFDYVGKRFGFGVVLRELGIETKKFPNSKYEKQFQIWELQCDCGNIYQKSTKYLNINRGLHCGCKLKTDLNGKKFGKGTIIRFHSHRIKGIKSPRKECVWELQCDCGNIYKTSSSNLLSGTTSSCGCIKTTFHNSCHKKTLTIYYKTIKSDAIRRGITFQVEKDELEKLIIKQEYKCSLSGTPISFDTGTASLDRINNDKSYSIDNLQWVHRSINFMKNTMNQSVFIDMCNKVVEHNKDVRELAVG